MLDVSKAFDTVFHNSIVALAKRLRYAQIIFKHVTSNKNEPTPGYSSYVDPVQDQPIISETASQRKLLISEDIDIGNEEQSQNYIRNEDAITVLLMFT